MSKSLGNFYTLRDLFAKGHRPSSDPLFAGFGAVSPAAQFHDGRIAAGGEFGGAAAEFRRARQGRKISARRDRPLRSRNACRRREADFEAGLADDLNTAQALAAVFDLVRDVNTAMDRGEFRRRMCRSVIGALKKFDAVLCGAATTTTTRSSSAGIRRGSSDGISRARSKRWLHERQEARKAAQLQARR